MKLFVVLACLIAATYGRPQNANDREARFVPYFPGGGGGPAIATQHSEAHSNGPFGGSNAHGVAEAHNNGFGGAIAHQSSVATSSGFSSSSSASGHAVATSGGRGPILFRRSADDIESVDREARYNPYINNFIGGWGRGGPAVSHQGSDVRVGAGGTGIAAGDSSAVNNGPGGAFSSQTSTGRGGPGSLVIAQGSSSAVAGRPRVFFRNARFVPDIHGGGGPAVSGQHSDVKVGAGGTGVAHGDSSATNNGHGGAISTQTSSGRGGPGSMVISSGSSDANALGGHGGGFRPGSDLGGFLGGRGNGGPAISHQGSDVKVGAGGTGIAHGDSTAVNSGHGGAISTQTSSAKGGPGSLVIAEGSSKSVAGGPPRVRRSQKTAPLPPTDTDFINSILQAAAKDPKAVVVSSSISAKSKDAGFY